jgi:hypothetical protein
MEKVLIEIEQAHVIDIDVSQSTWNLIMLLESTDSESPNQKVLLVGPELCYGANFEHIKQDPSKVYFQMEIHKNAISIGFVPSFAGGSPSELFSLLGDDGELSIYQISTSEVPTKPKKGISDSNVRNISIVGSLESAL